MNNAKSQPHHRVQTEPPHASPLSLDELPPTQRTLAIPLVGRALARSKYPELGFSDPLAERLLGELGPTLRSELERDTPIVKGSIFRTQTFDAVTRQYLREHPNGTIVHLGVGLCTRRERIGTGEARWVEADVRSVMEARVRLIPSESENVVRVSADLNSADDVRRVLDATVLESTGPVLVIAEGVLMFLEPEPHRRLLQALEARLPADSQILFDYMHPVTAKLSRMKSPLKATGASYRSGWVARRDLAGVPRLMPRDLRLYTHRFTQPQRLLERALSFLLSAGAPLYDVALLDVKQKGADGPRDGRSYGSVIAITLMAFALFVGLSAIAENPFIYAALQLATAAVIMRSFCLVHDLSHGALLRSKRANDLWGAVASVPCATPYYPWKLIHRVHHKWAGHAAQDPTEDGPEFHELPPAEKAVARFAWRTWLPLITVSVSIRTFWNLPKLFEQFPNSRDRARNVASCAGLLIVHGAAIALFGMLYVKAFVPAFLVWLFVMDPLVTSQHMGIPVEHDVDDPKPTPYARQEVYARTLLVPRFFARHVLLGFNYHSVHHARPMLPGHVLDSIAFDPSHEEGWWSWLTKAKRSPLDELLERKHLGPDGLPEPDPKPPADAPKKTPKMGLGLLIKNALSQNAGRANLALRAAKELGGVVRLPVPGKDVFLITHPEGLRQVMVTQSSNYSKSFDYKILSELLGQGLLTSEGEHWLRDRRIQQPAFQGKLLEDFHQTLQKCALAATESFRDGDQVCVDDAMTSYAIHVIGERVLTTDVRSKSKQLDENITVCQRHIVSRGLALVDFSRWVWTPGKAKFRRARGAIYKVLDDFIDARMQRTEQSDDLFSLLAAQDIPREGMRDQFLTLFLAGFETTAMSLTWLFHCLSQNPEAERRIRDEVRSVVSGDTPTYDELKALQYTRQAIHESMRLYPAVGFMGREALSAQEISGHRIPKGATIVLCPYATHRLPELWEDPETFDPDRFEGGVQPGTFSYTPFAHGPRKCIGAQFALMEIQTVVATVFKRFRMVPVTDEPVHAVPLISLRPSRSVTMRLVLDEETPRTRLSSAA